MLAGLRAGACAKCRAGRASCAGCVVGVAQTWFLVVEKSVAILERHQDLDTLSTAVPVPRPEETVMVHRKPWKGGSDAGFSGGHRWKGRPKNVGFC